MIRLPSCLGPAITIETEKSEFFTKTDEHIKTIYSKPAGRELLDEILKLSKNGKGVQIYVVDYLKPVSTPILTKNQMEKYKITEGPMHPDHNAMALKLCTKTGILKSEGTSCLIDFNINIYAKIDQHGRPVLEKNANLSYISLAHELVHAYRILKGTFTGTMGDPHDITSKAAEEEDRAVGINAYANERFSENAIRKEHGLPQRLQYSTEGKEKKAGDNIALHLLG